MEAEAAAAAMADGGGPTAAALAAWGVRDTEVVDAGSRRRAASSASCVSRT